MDAFDCPLDLVTGRDSWVTLHEILQVWVALGNYVERMVAGDVFSIAASKNVPGSSPMSSSA